MEKGPLMNTKEAASYLGLAEMTLRIWRTEGKGGPPYVRINKRVIRYRRSDLDHFVENCLVNEGDDLN